MKKMIKKSYIGPDMKNELYAEGYRYLVDGDYKTLDTIDPWSGMPNTTNNIYAFSDRAEAEAFAVTQTWVFNHDVHAEVEELPEHTETWREFQDRYVREQAEAKAQREAKKAEAKAKREAKEAKKAADAGMTLDEYKKAKALEKQIARLEVELAEKKEELEKLLKS